MERKYEKTAQVFVKAIKMLAEKPENLDNLESYLSQHFEVWMRKYANTPNDITYELLGFAEMNLKGE